MIARASILFVLLGGCGGSDEDAGTSSGTLPDGTAESLCDDYCPHAIECGWSQEAVCDTDCHDWADVVRGDMLEWIGECAIELPCDQNPLTCWTQAEDEFTFSEDQHAYLDACHARLEDCGVNDAGLIDFACNPLERTLYASDEAIGQLGACLEENCDEIEACTRQVTDSWNL